MTQREEQPALQRRHLLGGVGTVGALAAAAALLPPAKPDEATATVAQPAADKDGGYQASEHVLRYYQTARV